MIKNLNLRQQLLLSVLALIVCVKYILLPWLEWQSDKSQLIAELAASLPEQSSLLQASSELEKSIAGLETHLAQYRKQLPLDGDSSRIEKLSNINSLAKEFAVTVKSSGWQSKANSINSQYYTSYSLNLSLEGAAVDFLNYLNNLEHLYPHAKYEAFRVGRARGNGNVTATLKLNFFFRK